jgi:hypothetical protein
MKAIVCMSRPGNRVARALSSKISMQTSRAMSTNANKEYIGERSLYGQDMKSLRLAWRSEYLAKVKLAEEAKEKKKQEIVAAKAIRLREKRKASVLRQEADKKAKEIANGLYLEHLARNYLVYEERKKERELYRSRYLDAFENEKSYWITLENMEEKITEDLFDGPKTTGLVNKDSEHWRWQAHVINIKRYLDENYDAEADASVNSIKAKSILRGEVISHRNLVVQDFLEPIISTGEHRDKYDELFNLVRHDILGDDPETWMDLDALEDDFDYDIDTSDYDNDDDDSDDEDEDEDGEEEEEDSDEK